MLTIAEAEAGRSAPRSVSGSSTAAAAGPEGSIAVDEHSGGKRAPSLVTDASFGFINGCVGIPIMISFASITFRVSQSLGRSPMGIWDRSMVYLISFFFGQLNHGNVLYDLQCQGYTLI